MWRRWTDAVRGWGQRSRTNAGEPVRIGLALGGGFARTISHIGVLQVFEEHQIPIHAIAGISSGAIIASAYACGTPLREMVSTGTLTSFGSYARWTLSRVGFATNTRMTPYLRKILKYTRFEEMQIPLAVVATDLQSGAPVVFKDKGDVIDPIRASCAYPGLFLPVEIDGRSLVDGGIGVSAPVEAVAGMGATHIIAVYLHTVSESNAPPNTIFQVVSRCFAILQDRMHFDWRSLAHLVLEPEVRKFSWDSFSNAEDLVQAGREAALAALPEIEGWLGRRQGLTAEHAEIAEKKG